MRLLRTVIAAAFFATVGSASAGAESPNKPVAGCPPGGGWELVTLASIGLDGATGAPSFDGNADGWTCIRLQELGPPD